MLATLRSTFLSLLLLTVASGVKADTTTVTLWEVNHGKSFNPNDAAPTGLIETHVSPIGLAQNGGTIYVEHVDATTVEEAVPGTPSLTATITVSPVTATFIEAASWLYVSAPNPSQGFNDFETNCTLGTNGTTAECIEILRDLEHGNTQTITVTSTAQVLSLATITVTGAIPTSTSGGTSTKGTSTNGTSTNSAAMTHGYSIFNRMTGVFLGIFFVVMLVLDL